MQKLPVSRPRRLRKGRVIRELVGETCLLPSDLMYPIFVIHGGARSEPVASMPGVEQLSPDLVLALCARAWKLGIRSVLLFGIPAKKDQDGFGAWADDAPVPQAIRLIKQGLPEMLVLTDVCLCQYAEHGHCGVLRGDSIDNDATLDVLGRIALSHARAGADMVAPAGMVDGQVGAIRHALDQAGFQDVGIMSYSAKYASAFYGPFREAADSRPQLGDRASYQMQPSNAREALREVALDVAEGADIVMVKPAMAYLDIVGKIRAACLLPVAAYNVSGEYAMVKAAAAKGWIDERQLVLEILLGMKRAGADIIISYHALDAARWLADGGEAS
ncbi:MULTISPECIES: porphobilinogen synthase [unclassified Janthinobacterium]|uniref:porphobilinogen synthase n=1 Tax=unclassified Janthinobacterium TaxID=2610881 RepID=UPI000475645E|nr:MULTISPECIES: porphobilinogen synthase [unclassified Janthinobacterium]MEC5161731.1 porphobilinogen synthase [Janthinobacterium sp. CG_S6]